MAVGDQAKAAEEEAKERSITRKKEERILAFVIFCVTVLPGLTLINNGLSDQAQCNEVRLTCLQRCYNTYREVDRRFQSEMKGELGCKSDCNAQAGLCDSKAASLIMAALLLATAVACGFFVNTLLPIVLGDDKEDLMSEEAVPRACYHEPVFAEETQKKMDAEVKPWPWSKKKKNIKMEEVKCFSCSLDTEVDARWFKGQRSGLPNSICPRCRTVLAGVL
eukprot:TRINITY_DN32607_c0_g1_i1.p1 TRINITY_DN32607_c0_g1~~TRINITY_DN32607_c0_g1_i1.p1  ORF type:complete len:234 (-),score=38.89 TRINITY_DN32607_c0_g1_i1:78-740(-)